MTVSFIRFSARDICFIGIFTALICVLAPLGFPMPYGVPFTLQTFMVPLAGVALSRKNGTFAVLLYVLLGSLGLPVFAGYAGGIGVTLGPTGGFLLSFPLVAFLAGIPSGVRAKKRRKFFAARLTLWLVIGMVINYLCGTLWFAFVTHSGLQAAFAACVLPFIPTAILKTTLAAVLGQKIKSVIAACAINA